MFSEGRWSKAAGLAHDYMGFSATRDAPFSSGHPAPRSVLTNPFGPSHGTNTVYVFDPHPNSRMKQSGIYYTRNDGLRWKRAAARGLSGELNSLPVHPVDSGVVAAGTGQGLYLSHDAGENFERLAGEMRVFRAINTVLSNLKTALTGTYHAVKFAKYASRYLAEVQYRFNRRYDLRSILQRLLRAAVTSSSHREAALRRAEVHR